MPLVDKIALELGAREPWPKDVKLYQPYEMEQIILPDNANCLAVKTFFKMCGLDFDVEMRANAEAMSPSLRVPFVKVGRFVVADLEGIVQFVNGKGITLTEKLDADKKADMRAFMSLVHHVLEIAELYICWIDKENYDQITSVRNGSVYPWPLNHIQNRSKRTQVTKKLKALDWHNKTLNDVLMEVQNCCEALSTRLGDGQYFFEEGPTELDALVFGHLFTILTTQLQNSLAKTILKYPNLVHLIERMEKEFFSKEESFQKEKELLDVETKVPSKQEPLGNNSEPSNKEGTFIKKESFNKELSK